MEKSSIFEAAQAKLNKLQTSPEYQQKLAHFRQECLRIEHIATELSAHFQDIQRAAESSTVRTEFASGSTLHRGFYCPSPVFDFVVGNTHRGRLLKRVTHASKPSHKYGFAADGRLLWCNRLQDGVAATTEYLASDGPYVLGIRINSRGDLSTVTEEFYQDNKLIRYTNGLFTASNGNPKCRLLTVENYAYDSKGLCSSDWHELTLPPENVPAFLKEMLDSNPFSSLPIYQHCSYQFQREDGLLSGFTSNGSFFKGRLTRSAQPAQHNSGIQLMDIKE